jgi:competence protein ComEC
MIALEGERDTDTFNSITVAALFLLIINPSNLFELGFQLSFAAAGCIIYGFRRIYPILFGFAGREGFISTLVTQPFTVSLCAQAGVTALIAHYFFRLPIIALIANVFVIPFAALSVGIGFALIIINLLHISLLTQIFAGACFFSTTLTLKLVQLFAAVPHGHYWIGSVSPLFVIFYFLLFVTLINAKKSLIARKSFIYILLIACNVLIWSRVYHIYHPENRITVLDVGMGNSLFCEFANGKKVLIDGGKWTKTFDTGEGVVAPFLRAKGIRRIDAVIATSPYYYNTGGLVYIMENFDVKGAATNNAPYPTWSYYKFLKTIYENGISYRSLSSGDFFGPFEVLNPTQETLREVNDEPRKYTKDASLSLFLNIGNNSILLPGDAPHLAVKKSNIMKAPYFGGYRDSLVSRVSPDIVIIQVGRNRWNLPDEDMLGIYREKIHKIFRTDKDGAIIVKFNDKRFHLSTMKELSRDESWKEKLLRWTGNI